MLRAGLIWGQVYANHPASTETKNN